MFSAMEKEFNDVEAQLILKEEEVKLNNVSYHFGKAVEIYKMIVEKLEIFEPKKRPTAPENLKPFTPHKSLSSTK
jgi:hypothetical protein